jgi:hypothetical protein
MYFIVGELSGIRCRAHCHLARRPATLMQINMVHETNGLVAVKLTHSAGMR